MPGNSAFRILIVLIPFAAFAQAPSNSGATLAAPSVSEKWEYFQYETIAPFTLGAGAFNAAVSQVTQSTPRYGRDLWPAYPQRFGASVADIVSQNFWGDFVLASALHEDTRYRRIGESHKLWPRVGYAISRSIVTRTDSGKATFNWSNVLGTAMSAGLSNAYYPPASRTAAATLGNWGTDIAGSGLANLMPEFLPNFKRWLKRHHLF
jgi:hypothetical protein